MSFRSALLIGLALLLAACSRNPFEVTTSNCPAVAVLSNAGNLTRFVGEGRNSSDVAFDATITGIKVECDESKEVDVDLTFAIVARRGPALAASERVTVPYFVALVRDNNLITAKQVYESVLVFEEGASRAGVRERIAQHFADVDVARRYDYELIIGFQLTPDEVVYNALR